MPAQAKGTMQEDNAVTRVTLWSFPPHGETGFHRHEYDYVVVPLSTAPLTIVDKQGRASPAQLTAGASYFRKAGVEHNVINASDREIAFVEIEFK
ncbi:MAG: cupin domain-containing protein [Kiloniellaceae bacterium]